ncbi:MAG TPA: non-ribosomal peptide synthetase, partial [Desulfobacterales bacterium]|nr:non-ribosomal peptide synthetase [Desulfobacterales bacterium]
RELLARVRETAQGAYAHQDLPFEKLIEALNPERDPNRNPLFQVEFAFQNPPIPVMEASGLTLIPLPVAERTEEFDLSLNIVDDEQILIASFEYNTDLFDDATITRMIGHFQTLLEGIVANPEQCLSELPLLTDAERHQLLVEWNATRADFPKGLCIHEVFESQVEQTPDAVAVVFEDKRLSYRELNQQANQLAHYLQKLGVGPEVLVGICVERSLEMVVGVLGILKAGGAHVPLDPTYPKSRLAFMLKDARPSVLITQSHLVESLPEHRALVVCLDTDWEVIARESRETPVSQVTADNLAYVIYTSGTTGQPKGVLGLHRGTINRFSWMWKVYPFGKEELCCQKTSLNFVDSVWEIFGPLLKGVPVLIIPDEVVKDPVQLVETLAKHNVTRIVLVPSLLRAILDTYDDLQKRLPDLQIWVSSGEALLGDIVRRFREIMPSSVLLNLYGSTEVSADVTWYDVTLDTTDVAPVPIGRPLSNTQIYILDRYLQPVPVGVPGEL